MGINGVYLANIWRYLSKKWILSEPIGQIFGDIYRVALPELFGKYLAIFVE